MEFVTFEIAKKLKEKGFREKCFATYTPYGGIFKFNEIDIDKIARCDLNIKDFGKLYNYYKDSNIDAPTIFQVLKWLREEKLILIGLSPMQEYDVEETIEWCATVYKADKQGGLSLKEEFYYESYELAALAGIEYVLDNLI